MKVRCIHEENIRGRLSEIYIPIRKFCKFQYLRDVNLNSAKYDCIFDLSFGEFKRNVNFLLHRTKRTGVTLKLHQYLNCQSCIRI